MTYYCYCSNICPTALSQCILHMGCWVINVYWTNRIEWNRTQWTSVWLTCKISSFQRPPPWNKGTNSETVANTRCWRTQPQRDKEGNMETSAAALRSSELHCNITRLVLLLKNEKQSIVFPKHWLLPTQGFPWKLKYFPCFYGLSLTCSSFRVGY